MKNRYYDKASMLQHGRGNTSEAAHQALRSCSVNKAGLLRRSDNLRNGRLMSEYCVVINESDLQNTVTTLCR